MRSYEILKRYGIALPIADGIIHRKGSFWYALREFEDSVLLFWGDWKDGDQCHVVEEGTPLDKAQLKDLKKEVRRYQESARKEGERYLEKINFEYPNTSEHPYLAKKGIKAPTGNGLKIDPSGNLFVPIENIDGEIISYQKISPSGNKQFLTGLPVKCGFVRLGSEKAETIVFCEGFATGCSIFEALPEVQVVCCLSCANYQAVVKQFKGLKYESDPVLVLAADNDDAGVFAAREVERLFGVPYVVTEVTTDFNDMHRVKGISGVRDFLLEKLPRAIGLEEIHTGYSIKHSVIALEPVDIADRLLKENKFIYDTSSNVLYRYTGKVYEAINEIALEALIAPYENKKNCYIDARVSRVEKALKVSAAGDINDNFGVHLLPVNNGIYDLHLSRLVDFSPAIVIRSVASVDYDGGASDPFWQTILTRIFGDVENKKLLLQQYFGYCLMQNANYKKALWLLGSGSNGKSTILRVLEMLIGSENRASVSLSGLRKPEKRYSLVGKLINVVDESDPEASFTDEGFKQLVNIGTGVSVRALYNQEYIYTPKAKHILSSNHPIKNLDYAVRSRVLLLRFNNIIKDRDPELFDILKSELPGILNWAIEGARTLYENNGEFQFTGSEELQEIYSEQQPLRDFFLDRIEPDAEGRIEFTRLLNAIRDYDPSLRFKSPQFLNGHLKERGIECKETTYKGKKARYIFGYSMRYE